MNTAYASRGSVLALAAAGAIAAGVAYLALSSPGTTYRETVTIATDDARVSITAVSQYGKPVDAQGIGTPQAKFQLVADEDGIPCDTDELEVRTSNNITHYPRLNLCEARWRIELPTAVTPPPPGLKPEPSLKWIRAKMGDAQQPLEALHYGVPETDGTLMTATCQPHSGRITAQFPGSNEGLDNATTVRIDFYTPSGVLRYDATVDKPQEAGAEEFMPFEIEQSPANPFWQNLAGGAPMPFRIHTAEFHLLDATTGAAAISNFVKICSAP